MTTADTINEADFTPLPHYKPVEVRAYKMNNFMRVFIPKMLTDKLGWEIGEQIGIRATEDGIRFRLAPADQGDTLIRPLSKQKRNEARYVNVPISVLRVIPKLPDALSYDVVEKALFLTIRTEEVHA